MAGVLALWLDQIGGRRYGVRGTDDASRNPQSAIRNPQFTIILGIPLALLAALVAFAITSPYAILDAKSFLQATLIEQGRMVRGLADMPFTRQYRNTTPYLYFLQQQLEWGMGYPLGIVAGLGRALCVLPGDLGEWSNCCSVVHFPKLEIGVLIHLELGVALFRFDRCFYGQVQPLYEPRSALCGAVGGGVVCVVVERGRDKETRWQGDKGINADEPLPSSPRHLVTLSKSVALHSSLI